MRPNILIPMVDQLAGTLWPEVPALWQHAPDPTLLAERSMRNHVDLNAIEEQKRFPRGE